MQGDRHVSEQNAAPAQEPELDAAPEAAVLDAGAAPDAAVLDAAAVPDAGAAPEAGAMPRQPGGTWFAGIGTRRTALVGAAVIVVAVLLLGLGAVLLPKMFGGDGVARAKAGDCIASLTAPAKGEVADAPDARIVDCATSDAKFTVIGRVENQSEAQFNADSTGTLKICADAGHKDAEYMFWSATEGGSGYVLCLIAKK